VLGLAVQLHHVGVQGRIVTDKPAQPLRRHHLQPRGRLDAPPDSAGVKVGKGLAMDTMTSAFFPDPTSEGGALRK
jgi:hypothetical protein